MGNASVDAMEGDAMKRMFVALLSSVLFVLTVQVETPKATRINRAIELLASGQPLVDSRRLLVDSSPAGELHWVGRAEVVQ